jgi:tRNA(fMet)-specific endonuclease VapC
MADRPVLDSDVLIDYLRGAGPGLELVDALRQTVGFLVTAISAFELAAGRSYARDPAPVHALLRVPLLGLTRTAGLRAGALFRALRSEGHGIEVRDAMQAGVCLEARRALVTRNLGHFERVGGLRVVHPEDWPRDQGSPAA